MTAEEPLELTLVRHGVTEWNAQLKFQGHSDVPLSASGREQAALLAERLANRRFERIYSSDLRRAVETARAIGERNGLEPITDTRLREFAFGAWEGLTWTEILAAYPHLSDMSFRAAHLYKPDGGEDFDAVCERVRSFYEDIAMAGLQRIAVVSHAGALHATLGVLGLTSAEPERAVNFFPASVTEVLRSDGVWRLISGPTALQ